MSERQKRLKANQTQLLQMYEYLFGSKYLPGLQQQDKSEFNSILDAFRQRIYFIRQTQKEREGKQAKKGYRQDGQQLKLNQQLRQQIVRCQDILKEALNRMKLDAKSNDKKLTKKIIENRQNMVKNCYQMLKDVKETEQGGQYVPPPSFVSLQQIKLQKVNRKQQHSEVDLQQQQAIDRFKRKDNDIDNLLDQVINIDKQIKNNLKAGNEIIDATSKRVQDNLKKVDQVQHQVTQATKDLKQLLKTYRKPSKCCLDILLIVMLLALVGVIINMIKSPPS